MKASEYLVRIAKMLIVLWLPFVLFYLYFIGLNIQQPDRISSFPVPRLLLAIQFFYLFVFLANLVALYESSKLKRGGFLWLAGLTIPILVFFGPVVAYPTWEGAREIGFGLLSASLALGNIVCIILIAGFTPRRSSLGTIGRQA